MPEKELQGTDSKHGDLLVHVPEVEQGLLVRLRKAGWPVERFCGEMQDQVVAELQRQQIVAAKVGESRTALSIFISEYRAGHWLVSKLGFACGDCLLAGTAVLQTASGSREIQFSERCARRPSVDHTSENIRHAVRGLVRLLETEDREADRVVGSTAVKTKSE